MAFWLNPRSRARVVSACLSAWETRPKPTSLTAQLREHDDSVELASEACGASAAGILAVTFTRLRTRARMSDFVS